ncbi:hypothetical protein C4B60_10370 [Jeotgalibacillus proteolyticus]|uniref:Uncharacterized protein n=1 Tax=Jeotgalibacillus proteolyticus TaxID=2082395 RepID=A0A2S5GAH6_9BACL|nr:hypothetical protein C4B60_10370 [Jeotgalibacillus proteolyticus]
MSATAERNQLLSQENSDFYVSSRLKHDIIIPNHKFLGCCRENPIEDIDKRSLCIKGGQARAFADWEKGEKG